MTSYHDLFRHHWGRWICLLLAMVFLWPLSVQAQTAFPEPPEIHVDPIHNQPAKLAVQFNKTTIQDKKTNKPVTIWTRSYALDKGRGRSGNQPMIPGPSIHFQPGDLLQININNLLNDQDDPHLKNYEDQVKTNVTSTQFDTDEIIHHTRGEVNIPHNPNNTNLHTHGLHVDPDKDDVTIIIIPQGDSSLNYDAALRPHIKHQNWLYQYKIPELHLPGTHWYHAHKHGSTAVHVENGMAGALIIDPKPDIVPRYLRHLNKELLDYMPDEHDRVMILQEITNYGLQKGTGSTATITPEDIDSGFISAEKPSPTPPGTNIKVTVNGAVLPSMTLGFNQVERWRFINAASNHLSFGYLWLGKDTGKTRSATYYTPGAPGQPPTPQSGTQKIYQQVPMYLVALDGIRLNAPVEITAQAPLLMGPGNRADVVVQFSQAGEYTLFKNFPLFQGQNARRTNQPNVPSVAISTDAAGTRVLSNNALPASWYQAAAANPYLFRQANSLTFNFAPFQNWWVLYDDDLGKPPFRPAGQMSTVPMIRVKEWDKTIHFRY